MSSTASSASASASTSTSSQPSDEISTVVPDKEKIVSDLKAFMSHHAMATALERKKLKEKENELKEAKTQIEKLNTEVLDLNKRLKGAEMLWKENAGLRKFNADVTSNLQTSAAKNVELDATLKEKDEEISRLEQQVENLSEFKQKVELAQRIFKSPITNFKIHNQQNETHFKITGPLNEAGTATSNGNGTGHGHENGEETSAPESESSTSEPQNCTRVARAKRGRPF